MCIRDRIRVDGGLRGEVDDKGDLSSLCDCEAEACQISFQYVC